jgi:hypothetical protein
MGFFWLGLDGDLGGVSPEINIHTIRIALNEDDREIKLN